MTFEFQKYKREKASIIPIEEIYTDLDINANDPYVPNVGYRFDSPRRWSNDGSKNKSIGIRDLHLTPSSGDIRCRFLSYANFVRIEYNATWTAEATDSNGVTTPAHYAIDTDNPRNVDFSTPIQFQTISDRFNCQVMPTNAFEEIITSMIDFINGPVWKGFKVSDLIQSNALYGKTAHQTNRGRYYVVQTTAETTFGGQTKTFTTTTTQPLIMNVNSLKIPNKYRYNFDSNTSYFAIERDEPRLICMTNASKSDYDSEISDTAYDNLGDYNLSDVLNRTEPYLDNNENPINNLTCCHPYPVLYSNELLLIIDKNDDNSIKSVYDLFNQHFTSKDDLPIFNIDGKNYVIPFLKNSDIENGLYKSRFSITYHASDGKNRIKFGNSTLSNNNDLPGFRTNLKLSNVWDRLHLIYHASFAETRHRIIGRNGDHWDTPNKQFIVPSGDQDQFYIRFTTDGTHSILPIGCHFNVDLTFMLNPTKNTATGIQGGNHDKFAD